MATTEIKQIMDKLDSISTEIGFIKDHLKDIDLVMTEDDLEALHQAEKDLRSRKTKRLN